MNWKFIAFCMTMIFFCCVVFAYRRESISLSTGYEQLDKNIVDAFNSSPKKTKEVYTYSQELLSMTKKNSSVKSREWTAKAEKLITLSCYNEVMKAYARKDFKNALLWCERGLSSGAKSGKISDYNIKDFYILTQELKSKIESKLKDKDISYSKQELSLIAKKTPDKIYSTRTECVDNLNKELE